jgi:hypothetical protein
VACLPLALAPLARAQCFQWQPAASGPGPLGFVYSMEVHDKGNGPQLYIGGWFDSTGSVEPRPEFVARLRPTGEWGSIGKELGERVFTLLSCDLGAGTQLLAGGYFQEGVKSWGPPWSSLDGGVPATRASVVYDDGSGPKVFVGGHVTTFFEGIARWDGTSWSGLAGGLQGTVLALTVWDDGHGPKLYAGGEFSTANGNVPANGLACWDGTSWSAVLPPAGGSPVEVHALEVFDDGNGPALFLGGYFDVIGGASFNNIARWDGVSLQPLADGIKAPSSNGGIFCLAGFDDGGGADLYAGGYFYEASGTTVDHLARWDGKRWSRVGSVGPGCCVEALQPFDDGNGLSLYVAGQFSHVGTMQVNYVAKWAPSGASMGTSYCTAGSSAAGCQPFLSACGSPSASAPSGFELRASEVEGAKQGLFFFGSSGRQANPWGNGTSYQCVVPPVVRAGLLAASGTAGVCDGAFTQDLNALWCPSCPKPLKNPGAGATVQAQLWYRDPLNTSNQTTSLSDATELVVGP